MRNLIERFPDAKESPRGMNLVRQIQHGSTNFNGNDSHQLINSTRKLRMVKKLRPEMHEVRLFSDALKSFGDVVHSAFGSELDPSYSDDSNNFRKAYECGNF